MHPMRWRAGAELTTVRDNLRHASISTTSIYLHGDEVKRAIAQPIAGCYRSPLAYGLCVFCCGQIGRLLFTG
jgi:hypothetical protein